MNHIITKKPKKYIDKAIKSKYNNIKSDVRSY